jgi:hypothetical protein
VTAADIAGDFKADFEMPQLVRTGAGLQFQPRTTLGGLRALLGRTPPAR